MTLIYPDKEFTALTSSDNRKELSIFLAGTIDNGNSYDWQNDVIKGFEKIDQELPYCLTFYNPRRANWESNASKELLEEQIKWEQKHLDKSDMIIMILSDNSKSPITLLELGLYAQSSKLIVFCTNKFYRFDNVRLTCEKYGIPLVNSTKTKDIIQEVKTAMGKI